MQQQEGQLIGKRLKEDKLESTEELCDIVKPLDTRAALSIYVRGQSHQKVINSMVETGQTVQIVSYVKKVGFQADYPTMRRPGVRQPTRRDRVREGVHGAEQAPGDDLVPARRALGEQA